jgi:hypothetical protein
MRACSAHWEIFFFKCIPIWKKELNLRIRFAALAEFQSIIAVDYLIGQTKSFCQKFFLKK